MAIDWFRSGFWLGFNRGWRAGYIASGSACDCEQSRVSADFLRMLWATDPSARMQRRIRQLMTDRCAVCHKPVQEHASRRPGDYRRPITPEPPACEHGDWIFSRELCGECGAMHYYCAKCGAQDEPCNGD